jgi:hypothetical protein
VSIVDSGFLHRRILRSHDLGLQLEEGLALVGRSIWRRAKRVEK